MSLTCLALSAQKVDHLLNSSRSVHVKRNVDEILSNGLANEVALLVRRILEKLLAEVIPERV